MRRILVCEDNRESVELVKAILRDGVDFEIDDCGTGQGCLERFPRGFDLVLLDLCLPDISGIEVLKRLRATSPQARVIVTTASESVDMAVAALRAGAAHYIRKPIRIADLRGAVKEALSQPVAAAPAAVAAPADVAGSTSSSPVMRKAYELIERVATKSVSVLIQGPTGSGKEHVARLLHERSGRPGPLVAVSCPGIPVNLAESMLFGHEKGAFTGASARHIGKLAQAEGGTIFLDEVADLTPEVQVKLLRVLQEREIEPIGADRPTAIDVRVVVASSRDLRAEVARGRFREDLLYRLADVDVILPSLRERAEDIPGLAAHFVREYAADHGEPERALDPEVYRWLASYSWPGNVRELRSLVRRLLIMAPPAGPVGVDESFRRYLQAEPPVPAAAPAEAPRAEAFVEVEDSSLKAQEKELIKRALAAHDHNVTRAAESLKIGRATLYRKMKRYGLAS